MAKKKTKLDKMSKKEKTSLAYALATNLAKHGKPQTPKEGLTKGQMKKREKNVKKFKKAFDLEENILLALTKKLGQKPKTPKPYISTQDELPANYNPMTGKFTQQELKNPKKADLNKDGELSPYEEKRGEAIEKAISNKKTNEQVFEENFLKKIKQFTQTSTQKIKQGDIKNATDLLKTWAGITLKSPQIGNKYKSEVEKSIKTFLPNFQFPIELVNANIDTLQNFINGALELNLVAEHHLKSNPDAKYVATAAPQGWFDVWEGEPFDMTGERGVLVGKFKTMKDAKDYANSKNAEQGKLEEEDKEYKVLSKDELEKLAGRPPTHPAHKKDRRYKKLMKNKDAKI